MTLTMTQQVHAKFLKLTVYNNDIAISSPSSVSE